MIDAFLGIPEAPHGSLDWGGLVSRFDWVRALGDCPQDPIHHAEGDVGIHTRMVLDALLASSSWQEAAATDRRILFAAALLHDVAKPATTVVAGDGRVSARGHSALGARMARTILWEMGMDAREREQVCALIVRHQLPFHCIENDDAERRVIAASITTRLDHLAILAEADGRGRTCRDQQRILDNVALFRELASELDCLSGCFPFPDAHTRVVWTEQAGRDPRSLAFDDTRSTATLMVGLPGAGKDTWIAQHAGDLEVISLDALRRRLGVAPTGDQGPVIAAAQERARELLREGADFVWNATNVTRSLRQRVLSLFRDYAARVRIVHVEAGPEALDRQNRARPDAVPRAALQRLVHRWEAPDLSEAHELIHVAPER